MSTKTKSNQNKRGEEVNDINLLNLYVLFDTAKFLMGRARELELSRFSLSPENGMILYTLISCGGESTLSDLSKTTFRQQHSVSTLTNRMAEQGLVEKIKVPGSSKMRIIITEKGRQAYENVTRRSLEVMFSVLTDEEKRTLEQYLARLKNKTCEMLGLNHELPF